MLTDVRAPDARHRKVERTVVSWLGAWPRLVLPIGEQALVVHLRPLQPAHDLKFRPMAGYHTGNPRSLTALEQEHAWVCWWPLSPDEQEAVIGSLLLGDISGFIPSGLGRRITGCRLNRFGQVCFEVEPLTEAESEVYTSTRIKSLPGRIWQEA